jgi:CPA1 family monovalent cation:H+ antiporter
MNAAHVVEFLLGLLIAASVIALVTSRLKLPYTIALVIGGFAIDFFHIPIMEKFGSTGGPQHLLTPEIIFTLFLPALLFEAGININVRHLRHNLAPIALLAVAGVIIATLSTGFAAHFVIGLPVTVALLFGALIAATDPISVLALFKDVGVAKRLSVVVEGESLFNDGTAVVLFQILLVGVATGHLDLVKGAGRFVVVVLGGATLGLVMGFVISKLTERVDDPRIEITLSTILAYGAYLAAEYMHVSGVIATVAAGLMIGNYGAEIGMTARTRVALWAFWSYVAFVINSLVFLLIGIEVHVADLLSNWWAILLAIFAVLLGRVVAVYGLTPISNRFSEKIPLAWQHVLVWGGLHGGVSIALALSLSPTFPYRAKIMAMTFGVVAFSIIVQGLTMKPLLRFLGIRAVRENAWDRAKTRQMALASAGEELEHLLRAHAVSSPVYEDLKDELDERRTKVAADLRALASDAPEVAREETRLARLRLVAAEKSAVQKAASDGVLTAETADRMLAGLDDRYDALRAGRSPDIEEDGQDEE